MVVKKLFMHIVLILSKIKSYGKIVWLAGLSWLGSASGLGKTLESFSLFIYKRLYIYIYIYKRISRDSKISILYIYIYKCSSFLR